MQVPPILVSVGGSARTKIYLFNFKLLSSEETQELSKFPRRIKHGNCSPKYNQREVKV